MASHGCSRAGGRRNLVFALTISCVLALGSWNATEAEEVSLAGTFNNWNARDEAFAMKRTGDRHELVRFWPCGTCEFKFVFDGNWGNHLGDDGKGGLEQPGQNITLAVWQSGEYAVWFDARQKRWGLEKRPATRPRAVICVRETFGLRGGVSLDGLACIARPEHPIQTYRWEFTPPVLDAEGKSLQVSAGRSPYVFFVSPRAGKYEIRLTINDGEYDDTCTTSVETGEGWELHENAVPRPHVMTGTAVTPMLPLSDGRLAASLQAKPGEERIIHVEKAHAPPPPASFPAGQRMREQRITVGQARLLAIYDPRTDELSLRDSGWHEFVYEPSGDDRLPEGLFIERVELVGDFTSWRTGTLPMLSTAGGRVYRRILEVPDGVYHYKVLVNGSIWLEDRQGNPRLREPDNRGGHNSGVLIGLDGTKLGPARPDHVNTEAVKHDQASGRYFTQIASDLAQVTIRTLTDDVTAVYLLQATLESPVLMRRIDSRFGFDYWSSQILVEPSGPRYAFAIEDGSDKLLLGRRGIVKSEAEHIDHFQPDPTMSFKTPDWAKKAVWYQIFPERFRNGDASNDPPRTAPWQHAWFEPYKGGKLPPDRDFVETGTFNEHIFDRRYGGDFQGIQEKLPYLRDLGVTAIYFNPVFIAESLHKYDATDFRHIDDSFGVGGSYEKLRGETEDPATWQWTKSDLVFLDFLKEAHRQGFKVIIDGVFNHTGRRFWAFQDILKNGKDSPYAGWFEIKSWEPLEYEAWDRENGALPKLKHSEALGLVEPVRDHLFAVTRRWMDPNGDGDPSDGIDGWRLDVASDINANFWKPWRKLVKSINPDAYIVAELWEESREWLDGQTFDAVMNYPFARAAQRFFVNERKASRPGRFDAELREALGWYLLQVNYVLQNLFNSHDTDRVASMFMNPDLRYDAANRLQDNGPNYNSSRPTPDCYERLKAMVLFQMTFLGAPMVYYGDEVGMYGADDPTCRKPMYWEDLMPFDDPDERIVPGLRDFYRRMIAIRNAHPALQLGSLETLLAHDRNKVYAYCRSLGGESIVVVINNDKKPHKLDVPSPWPDGSRIVRLDDPNACEVIEPAADQPAARPTVRLIQGHDSPVKVAEGRLKGVMLSPRTGGIFMRVD
ncbi:MAG: alpha amylase N-terminal ig-like domain-containing protein [Planctomycetota bacterium]